MVADAAMELGFSDRKNYWGIDQVNPRDQVNPVSEAIKYPFLWFN